MAPSYHAFVALADGKSVNWKEFPAGGELEAEKVLAASRQLAFGRSPDLVIADIPLATTPIIGRRAADKAISQVFGSRWCSAHSPNRKRPGPVGERFRDEFDRHGYALSTVEMVAGPALVETYPHPTLLALTGDEKRLPYKVSRSSRYWPGLDKETRKRNLLATFKKILSKLNEKIEDVSLLLPEPETVRYLSELKRYEDALDALVCCWAGAEYVGLRSRAYGDKTAAIWVPI